MMDGASPFPGAAPLFQVDDVTKLSGVFPVPCISLTTIVIFATLSK